jgi:hypothetical protein
MAKAKATPKKDPQQHFEEQFLEDPELEALITDRLLTAEAARKHGSANRKLKDAIAKRGLKDDVRYRVDQYVFRLASHSRAAHEVDGGTTRRFAELGTVEE